MPPSQNGAWLDFEKPVVEIDRRLKELRSFADRGDPEFKDEYERLSRRAEKVRFEIYSRLSRWQRVQLARHPQRPYTLDYLKILVPDFVELHGDRTFADDRAIVAGMGRFAGRTVVIVGHQKGRDTKENIKRFFGMPHPEGYRKALRVMQTASRFVLPILTFIRWTEWRCAACSIARFADKVCPNTSARIMIRCIGFTSGKPIFEYSR